MRIGKRISVGLLSLALGFTAEQADAQPTLISAEITSPDSGSTVGIDSLVTVTAKVFQSSADSVLTVVAWLVYGGADAAADSVLFDNTEPSGVLVGNTSTSGADQVVLDALSDNFEGTISDLRSAGGALSGITTARSFVAARQIKGTVTGEAASGLPLDAGLGDNEAPVGGTLLAHWGDASSAAANSSVSGTDTYTYKISLKIPESAGNNTDQKLPREGIRVAVVAFDPNEADERADQFSRILVSGPDVVIAVDADRPSQEGISIVPDEQGSTGDVYIDWADGKTTFVGGFNTNVVDGVIVGERREVARAGDQIRVLVDLNATDAPGPGPTENDIKSPTSTLDLVVDLFGTEFTIDKSQGGSVLAHATKIAVGDFDNLDIDAGASATVKLFVVDAAGNKSSTGSAVQSGDPLAGDDADPVGVTAQVTWLADSTKPKLTGHVGDEDEDFDEDADPLVPRVTPADGETISDGTISDTDKDGDVDDADTRSVASDGSHLTAARVDPLLSWRPDEDLKSVKVEFVGSSTIVMVTGDVTVAGDVQFGNDNLASDEPTYLDITELASDACGGEEEASASDACSAVTNDTTGTGGGFASRIATEGTNAFAAMGDIMADGDYDIKLTPTDLAGNVGATVTRADVRIDLTEPIFQRRFPTKSSFGDITEDRRDTVNAITANVTFTLSEPADSVKIIFNDIGGTTGDTSFVLSTVQLADLTEQTILSGPSLTDNTDYEITIVARDLAGNFTLAGPDTLHLNTAFVAPVIAKFVVDIVDKSNPPVVQVIGPGSPFPAGTELLLRIQATAADDALAVTFDDETVLTITNKSPCAGCVVIAGDGVAVTSDTTYALAGSEFLVGRQTLTLTNKVAPETLTVSVTDAGGTYTGALDSVLAYDPDVYSAILVDAPAMVDQGEKFRVNVTLADEFGNTRVKDNRFVEVTSNVPGAQLPTGAIAIKKGSGWFDAVFSSGSTHTITVRDIVSTSGTAKTADYPVDGADTGDDFISGSDDVNVNSGPVAWNLGAPGAVDADDYLGASGNGDQGGFIILTFAASDDHATLDEYLIEREVEVNYTTGVTASIASGGVVPSDLQWVAWGSVAPTIGAETMYVVVATLDSEEARFAVSAVRGGVAAKQAFSVSDKVSTPYELMARTMQNSREFAQISVDAPVIATLAPEALAFAETGVVPRMKTGGEDRSRKAISNAVRGIDNIPPAPVVFLKALDTQSDLGGSITLTWSKSVDDQLLTQTVPNAVGGAQTYTVEGVKAYNIYRKAGDGEFALIGQAGSGETTFLDQTVFNGMLYTYQVRPSDTGNIAETELVSSALAVRNNVRDAQGVLVRGLFGVDNRVDFDDFFVLADRFGQSASDASFDPAFDLSPNNKVDLDDFFVFVDNFGRSITGTGKVVPMLAGLNSDARLYIDAGSELPRIGEEMTLTLNLEDYVELRGYGLTVNYDAELLEFVGTSVDNGLLGEGTLAQPQRFAETDGQVSIGAFGDVASKGDLGVNLVFRSRGEIESSFIEITDAEVRDGGYGINNVPTPVSVQIETRPEVYALADNYPNPFNPETTLKYQLPESADVTLEIYNMLGQVVRTLVNENQSAGRYTLQWDGKSDNRHSLSSGIYFYRIQAGGEFQSVKKMLLVK